MNYIQLHTVNNNKILVNLDLIESIGTVSESSYICNEEFRGMTYLVPAGSDEETNVYIVKEDVDTIISCIEYLQNEGV